MDVAKLSAEEAAIILNATESHFQDLKSRDATPGKLTQAMSAFANADGGELYIGIEDKKHGYQERWIGFHDQEAANAHVDLLTQLFPPGDTFSYAFLSNDRHQGLVLRCEVLKNKELWKDSAGDIYLRRGAQSVRQRTPEQLTRIGYNKGLTSFEDKKVSNDLPVLTSSSITVDFLNNIVPSAQPDAWLKKQKLIVDDQCTVAGLMLFAEEPQTEIPKASVKIYRYKTSEEASRSTLGGQPVAIEGCIQIQIKEAVRTVVDVVEANPVMKEAGLEQISYPRTAIHEIITNAVIHRDYSINDDVHVRVFDNRIEIYSPGRLPGHVTTKNILEERSSRNQKIVRLLSKFPDPPNKDVGEGLNAAFEAMRNLQLKDPVVSESDAGVLVVLRHEKLASPEQAIIEYLRVNEEINNRVARQVTSIGSENSVKRIFQKMMKAGIIERIQGRAQVKSAYRKGAKFPISGQAEVTTP